jgi:uncharacterized protein (DUF302 family)
MKRSSAMNSTPATVSYAINNRFEQALRILRIALLTENLGILGELDLSQQLQRDLGVGLFPCKVLMVAEPYSLLETMTFDPRAIVYLPLHLVVCRQESQTMVHCHNPLTLSECGLPAGAKAPLSKLQAQISKVLEKIATRQDVLSMAQPELAKS